MASFDATLFGVDAASFRAFGTSLMTPTLGFAFLYLLGRPLSKIPFIDVDSGYKPPKWVLPFFTLTSISSVVFSFTSSTFLQMITAGSDAVRFERQFQKKFTYLFDQNDGEIASATISLTKYDTWSNFYVFFNGYRISSSEVDCLMKYQCRPPSVSALEVFSYVESLNLIDNSLHHLHSLNSLPYTMDFSDLLVPGKNYLDIISVNSGFEDCNLSFHIQMSAIKSRFDKDIEIIPDGKEDTVTSIGLARFHSYRDTFPFIEPYHTLTSNASYRLCERLHFVFDIPQPLIPSKDRDEEVWKRWEEHQFMKKRCEILNEAGCK